MYTLPMPANIPPGEKVPAVSPIFPDLKTESIAKLEVHIQYVDKEGDKCWAEVPGFPVYAKWEDIQEKAGGGYFKVTAKGIKNNFIGHDKKRLHGPAKFLNEVRDAEETEEDDDADIDDASSDVRAIIKQQSIVLPAAFSSITTALVQSGEASAARMQAMVAQQQALVTSHSAQLLAVQATADARIDGYRAEADRLRTQMADLQKRLDELTGQNAGMLRAMATSGGGGGNAIIEAIKDIGPKLPSIIRGVRDATRPALGAGADAGAAAGTPTSPRITFGG